MDSHTPKRLGDADLDWVHDEPGDPIHPDHLQDRVDDQHKVAKARKGKRLEGPSLDRKLVVAATAHTQKLVLAVLRKVGTDVTKKIRSLKVKSATVLRPTGLMETPYTIEVLISDGVRKADLDEHLKIDLSGLSLLSGATLDDLEGVSADSANIAIATLGADDRSGIVNQVNHEAGDWASDHAADLVAQISDSTRTMLRQKIADGIEDGMTADEIADEIMDMDGGPFSELRSHLIANTEISRANSQGALIGYRAARDAGVAVKKEWVAEDDCCDDCSDNMDAGPIDLDDDFPSGDDASPAHPNCRCAVVPSVDDDGGTTPDDTEPDDQDVDIEPEE